MSETIQPGDPISASLFESMRQQVSYGVSWDNAMVGKRSAIGQTAFTTPSQPLNSIFAVLSGSSNPYSWQQCAPSSDDTGSFYAYGDVYSNAYEINDHTGLGGLYVVLFPTAAGDYRF